MSQLIINEETEEFKEQIHYTEKIRSKILLSERRPTAYIRTYGCQQNFADSEKIRGMLVKMDFQMASNQESADLILFNTCAIRENAEDKIFGNVGILKKLKEKNPSLIIVLCGCMVQQKQVAQKFKQKFPFIDIIFGTHIMHKLPELLFGLMECGLKQLSILDSDGYITEGLPVLRDSDIKANVSIMYGCDNFCTYCIVPYVRGRERSRNFNDIVREVRGLIENGYKEITLLGQNVNSYGKGTDYNFSDLLRTLDEIEGEFKIHYMTSHPKDCTKEFIDTVSGSKKISHHLHLPFQSGSNKILKLMNRNYTREYYSELINYAKSKIPNLLISTDIIVGFPGENYDDFKETLDLIKELGIHSAFTFIYSKRENTKAAEMPDPVSDDEKNKWFKELLTTLDEIGKNPYEKYIGEIHRVLCEGEGRSDSKYITGKNRQGIFVDFEGEDELIGKFINIEITKALNWALIGKRKD